MHNQYTAMMSSHQQNDSYKVFNRQGSSAAQPDSSDAVSHYYQELQGYNEFTNSHDMYQPMAMQSNIGGATQDYNPPLPIQMGGGGGGNQNSLSASNGLSRHNPTTHTATHPATSPTASSPPNRDMGPLSNLSSPGPSTSRLSISPDGTPSIASSHTHLSSSHSPGEMVKTESSDSNSVKSGPDDDNGVPPKKRPQPVANDSRDDSYWEKRKKNNESAKRSREARRLKEDQIALRVVYLEQENLQLRTELTLLKTEIDKLRSMLYNPH